MTAGRRLVQYASNYKAALVFSLVFVLAANLLKAAGPAVLERAIDHLSPTTGSSTLTWYSLLLTGITLLQGALMFGQERLLMRSAGCVERDLRSALFDHLQKLPLEYFQKHSTGELMAKVSNDLPTAISGTAQALMFSMDSVFALVIILPLMARISVDLTVMAFAPLFLVIATTLLMHGKMRTRLEQVQEHLGKVYSQAHASLSAIRTIKAFTQEQAEIEAFQRTNREYIGYYLKRVRLSGLLHPLLQFLIGLSSVAVLWYGGELTVAGKISIGRLLQFILYLGYVAWPMHVLGWQITIFQRGMVSMGRLHALLSVQPSIRAPLIPVNVRKPLCGLEFQEVGFRYPDAHRLVLEQISFQVQPGQIVGLVGAVGSGKSTLMSLVPRLFDPCRGKILICGSPLSQIPLDLLRSSIGYVPQETLLFNNTIAANLAYGRPEACQREIAFAAEAAGIDADIARFPNGYETIIGERGLTLSGGQKQRISIARAILRNSEILLLDDALSSVDPYTEEHILFRLRKVMAGKTCLVASHRVSTIRSADLILVLHQGRIVESGTHDQLLAYGGLYTEIDQKQRLEQKLAAS
ncbi:MAG: ABC transporter ATP-binding protein/permease [Acidobacteriia bacterium]|nr:ABC transporter ATP-binding protein/permease [Terriglobia bacterium]